MLPLQNQELAEWSQSARYGDPVFLCSFYRKVRDDPTDPPYHHIHLCSVQILAPKRRPTEIRSDASSSRFQNVDTGRATNQIADSVLDAANKRAWVITLAFSRRDSEACAWPIFVHED